jgi:hypothetical protein
VIERRTRWAVLTLGAVAIAACTSSGDATTTTTSTSSTTVPAVSSTTGSTTTVAPTTTTTTTPTTTTTTTATTTTTIPAGSTTTVDVVVQLTDEGIDTGAVWVPFGTREADAVAALTAALGPPTDDSGWVDAFSVFGTCPPPVVRGVQWDAFVMLFTRAETDFWSAGVPHFFAWYYTDVPPDLTTSEGLVIGDTIATLQSLYGGADLEIGEDPFDPTAAVWSYDLVGWTGLSGYADSQDPSGVITSINGGRGCGE